jgi:hypothetical protein
VAPGARRHNRCFRQHDAPEEIGMKVGRNDPCPCGSGRKYKHCHQQVQAEGKGDWTRWAVYVLAIAFGLGLSGFVYGVVRAPDDGRVWSAEHGHWHNADGSEMRPGGGTPVPQPPGPAPEGKVWSPEHGHWHDASPGEAAAE